MKKLDLGQTITILANVGVIAGIVFLGYELRQNNENLLAESRFNHASQVVDFFNGLAADGELSAILIRAREGEHLDAAEAFRLEQLYMAMITSWQWEYGEWSRNRIPAPTDSWLSSLAGCPGAGYPGVRQTWERTQGLWRDEQFVEFIEEGLGNFTCE